ncbi:hypothetical protein Rhe02_83910 [Rhizocola hellebori]|uniref:Uncharacterized protein n=1 Tax=Rhizocola hellebori TaxID=1392758 RepID=A0A8J3QIF6_9ACTN|nr:hypothetical protein [Rhizocola hellebori]GIH10324.1 hypothetical protein Rhe02_83910 [Rhizocola hellebori]
MVTFPVWDMPQLPELDRRTNGEAFEIHRGMAYGTGPGVIITSHDPSKIVIEKPASPTDGGTFSFYGAVHIANGVSLALAQGPTVPEYHQVTDTLLRCEDQVIPALAFDFLPDVQVVVSASLLTHAVAVVAWQLRLYPIRLEQASPSA